MKGPADTLGPGWPSQPGCVGTPLTPPRSHLCHFVLTSDTFALWVAVCKGARAGSCLSNILNHLWEPSMHLHPMRSGGVTQNLNFL